MKKFYWILIIVIIIAAFYVFMETFGKYQLYYFAEGLCLEAEDCRLSCGGCIGKNAASIMLCQRIARYSLDKYKLECSCENSRCVTIKVPLEKPEQCKGEARCFFGNVEQAIDGDTLLISNQSIRLAMVDAPEYGEEGYDESKEFLSYNCRVGANVAVDEDDGQEESYGRIVAMVYCTSDYHPINSILIANGHATIDERFCDVSEFADESWTGC
ncbi:MAG: thermonuclease family protein [Candidatus Aenigmatarchaeota archaeon]